MTPADELWLELVSLDARLADGIWDGTIPLDEGPVWSRRVGTLVATARAPALPDELAREAEILTEMASRLNPDSADVVPLAARRTERWASRRVATLGGIAAVKAATAILTALGAAAATTGLVLSLGTGNSASDRPPAAPSTTDSSARAGATEPRPLSAQTQPDSCTVLHIDCSPPLPSPAGPPPGSSPPTTAPASVPVETPTTTEPSTTATPPLSTPTPDAAAPSAPGRSGSAPGQTGANPGHSGSPPGQAGSPPAHPESPGHSNSAPGHSGSPPGRAGSPPGRPTTTIAG